MPAPLGSKAKIGWVEESSWGVPNTTGPYIGVPFLTEGLKNNIERARSEALSGFRGRLDFENPPANARAEGDIEMYLFDINDAINSNQALLLWYGLGRYSTIGTPTPNGIKFDTGEVSDANNNVYSKGLTIVVDRNTTNASGQRNYFYYSGCKVNQLTISGEENNFVRMRVSVVGKREEILTTAPTINITSGLVPMKFWFSKFYLSDGTEVPVVCRSFEITINNNLQTDRYFNNVDTTYPYAVLYDLPEGDREITGNMEMYFESTKWYEKMLSDSTISVKFELAASRIGSGVRVATIELPKVYITGETPNVGGKGPINLRIAFTAVTSSATTPELTITFAAKQ